MAWLFWGGVAVGLMIAAVIVFLIFQWAASHEEPEGPDLYCVFYGVRDCNPFVIADRSKDDALATVRRLRGKGITTSVIRYTPFVEIKEGA